MSKRKRSNPPTDSDPTGAHPPQPLDVKTVPGRDEAVAHSPPSLPDLIEKLKLLGKSKPPRGVVALYPPSTPDFGLFGNHPCWDRGYGRNYAYLDDDLPAVYYRQMGDVCGRLRYHIWETEGGKHRLTYAEHTALNGCEACHVDDLTDPVPDRVFWVRCDDEYDWVEPFCAPPTPAGVVAWLKKCLSGPEDSNTKPSRKRRRPR